MVVRIKFDADLVIEGKDMQEVKNKWNNLPEIFNKEVVKENCLEFGEVFLIEDAETCEDLGIEFNNA